jgi:hypothetical protein
MSFSNVLPIYYIEIGKTIERLNEPPIITFEDLPKSPIDFIEHFRCKAGLHIGQRKLFLSELQFLTKLYPKLKKTGKTYYILYAGAAPSNKTYYLASFFDIFKFILIDPNKFELVLSADDGKMMYHHNVATELRGVKYLQSAYYPQFQNIPKSEWISTVKTSQERIFLIENYMTDEIAEMFAELNPIFISDIRTNKDDDFPTDLDLLWNSAMQFNWINIMRPQAYMLKFRVPFFQQFPLYPKDVHLKTFEQSKRYGIDFLTDYHKKEFRYLSGTIYLQAFCGPPSSESRLCNFNSNFDITRYDCQEYENRYFYYNILERTFVHRINKYSNRELCFDHCNDCAIESTIWSDYCENIRKIDIYQCMQTMDKILCRTLGKNGHGIFFEPNKEYVIERISYQHINLSAIPWAAYPKKIKQIVAKYGKYTVPEIYGLMLQNKPKEYLNIYKKQLSSIFTTSTMKSSLDDIKLRFPVLHKMRSFKPIAHTFLNQVRGQLMYMIRFVIESKINTLVLLGPFGSHKYLNLLQRLIKIPIIYLLPLSNKNFSYDDYNRILEDKSAIYKIGMFGYPKKWEELSKLSNYGIFCSGWNMSYEQNERPTQSHYIGIYSKIYNIITAAKPSAYLLGFEPYIGPHDDIAILPRYQLDVELARKNGYDCLSERKKGKWLYFSGNLWIIPYGTNKATRFLIFGKDSINIKTYDVAECSEKMMYYNEFDRGFNLHPNKFANRERHYDFCNDCALDSWILQLYCNIYKMEFWKTWDYIQNEINNNLFIDGHGLLFSNKKDILVDMFRQESAIISNVRFSGL